MKIYFDKSGQSGCVVRKKDLLNFQKQPTFALGALVIPSEEQENALSKKYTSFLEEYDIHGEIKGSDLLTRAMNAPLSSFMDRFLEEPLFFVIIYDKRFYLATLLLSSLVGLHFQQQMPVDFYLQASFLANQDDDFFIRYLTFIESPSANHLQEYLDYLIHYNYKHTESNQNVVVDMAKAIVTRGEYASYCDDFMTFGWYDNPNQTNIINLNALAELIFVIKSTLRIDNNDIEYIHDTQKEFSSTFQKELQAYGINISFADSKDSIPLQVVDNTVSIFRHAYDKMIKHVRNKELWLKKSEWDMSLFSEIVQRIQISHIKFTVPVGDWSAALCIATMFTPEYPKAYHNNLSFNSQFLNNLRDILLSIHESRMDNNDILNILNK